MSSSDGVEELPEVGDSPLIIDVEFLEEEEESIAQPLDSVENVEAKRSRRPM